MSDQPDDQPAPRDEASSPAVEADATGPSSRRRVLMLGAVSASAVVTIRPALAATATSVLTCQIPVPDPNLGNRWIAPNGTLVNPGTPGAFPPMPRPLTGEEVKTVLQNGGSYPGTDYYRSQAYTNYIRRLQRGMNGFTCYASLQMPR